MIEWYRAHSQYELLMDDCMSVIGRAAETAGTRRFTWKERIADPFADPERMTVAEAFSLHAGIDILATLAGAEPDRRRFAAWALDSGVHVEPDDSWGDVFSRVMADKIEPYLGLGRPTILDEYPTHMSALARPKDADPRVAERFEIYVCGVELANGFGELNDAVEQRRRLAAQMAEKDRIYKERYPIDDDFIAAVRIMPPSCGVALGLDRLVMLATGATHIEQVMWSPVAEL
jgi:lysyl-tRNA synthetase class 2